jgi:UDP-N-acetylglucosamine acyltransferase
MTNAVIKDSNNIHPSAIIGPDVRLGSGITIGPFSILEGTVSISDGTLIASNCSLNGHVEIGENNVIKENCVISGTIRIGKNNHIGSGSNFKNSIVIGDSNTFTGLISIGTAGEMGTKGDRFVEDGYVFIGNKNVFREFISINSPVRRQKTSIGDNCYFMSRTYVPHDAIIDNNVTMATNSLIGGGVHVCQNAYLGFGSVTHQWLVIGESAMLGMNAAIKKNTPPFCTVVGVPAKILKFNKSGAQRQNHTEKNIEEVEAHFATILDGSYVNTENPIAVSIQNFLKNNPDSLTISFK